MDPLNKFCSAKGHGLPFEYLDTLRGYAITKDLEERKLANGYSYFPKGSKTMGRILKISIVKRRLYLEFNLHMKLKTNFDNIIWLDDDDRKTLHAGGVKFCYVGDNLEEAMNLIIRL